MWRIGGWGPYCWAMMRGMLGLSDCSGGAPSPVRLLNMGSVDRGGGTPRIPAMFLSSSVFPWMVWWWNSWILQQTEHHVQYVCVFLQSLYALLHCVKYSFEVDYSYLTWAFPLSTNLNFYSTNILLFTCIWQVLVTFQIKFLQKTNYDTLIKYNVLILHYLIKCTCYIPPLINAKIYCVKCCSTINQRTVNNSVYLLVSSCIPFRTVKKKKKVSHLCHSLSGSIKSLNLLKGLVHLYNRNSYIPSLTPRTALYHNDTIEPLSVP